MCVIFYSSTNTLWNITLQDSNTRSSKLYLAESAATFSRISRYIRFSSILQNIPRYSWHIFLKSQCNCERLEDGLHFHSHTKSKTSPKSKNRCTKLFSRCSSYIIYYRGHRIFSEYYHSYGRLTWNILYSNIRFIRFLASVH